MKHSPEVLSCPKCGGDDVSYGYGGPPWCATVECHAEQCRAIVIDYHSRSRPIIRWNAGYWHGFTVVDEDGFKVFKEEPGYEPRIDKTAVS